MFLATSTPTATSIASFSVAKALEDQTLADETGCPDTILTLMSDICAQVMRQCFFFEKHWIVCSLTALRKQIVAETPAALRFFRNDSSVRLLPLHEGGRRRTSEDAVTEGRLQTQRGRNVKCSGTCLSRLRFMLEKLLILELFVHS